MLKKIDLQTSLLILTAIISLTFSICWFYLVKFDVLDDLIANTKNIADPQIQFTTKWFRQHFFEWSQRVVIDVIATAVLKTQSVTLSKSIAVTMYVLFIFTLKKLLNLNGFKTVLLLLVTVGFYNLFDMESAGGYTTLSNYLFPTVGGVFICYVLLNDIDYKRKLDLVKIASLPFIAFYICSNEQVAFILALLLPLMCIVVKKNYEMFAFLFVIALVNIGVLYISGSPAFRNCINGITFPGYETFTTPYKLFLATTSTLLYYNAYSNAFTLFLYGTIIFCLFKDKLNVYTVVGTLVVLLLIQHGLAHFNKESIYLYTHWTKDPIGDGVDTMKVRILALISGAISLAFIVFTLFIKTDKKTKAIFLGLLAIAFIGRLSLAFSSSLYYSMVRTYFFSNTIILLASFYLLTKCNNLNHKGISIFACGCLLSVIFPRYDFLFSSEYEKNFPYKPFDVGIINPEKSRQCEAKYLNYKIVNAVKLDVPLKEIVGCEVTDFNTKKSRKCTQREYDNFLKEYKEKEFAEQHKIFFKEDRH